MSHPVRLLLLLVATQGTCLAFSLWVQDQFLIASAQWKVSQQSVAAETAPGRLAEDVPARDRLTAREAGGGALTVEALLDSLFASRVLGFVWTVGLQSIVAYLVLSRLSSVHEERESRSHEENLMRSKELLRTRDAVIFGLAKLAESRDPDTGQHLERIAMYATRLASGLRRHARYRDVVTPTFVRTIGISSALHDIGKVGVEDAVLLKPGRLSDEERFRMQIHPILGGECISQIEQQLGNSSFLAMAREIAFCHHERWDGEGYPAGLSGEEIPLSARIVAIADVYDALASRRVYKDAFPHEKCVEMIQQESGKQFDPQLVEVFLAIQEQFREVALRFAEPPPETVSSNDNAEQAVPLDGPGKLTAEQARLLIRTVDQPSQESSPSERLTDAETGYEEPITSA